MSPPEVPPEFWRHESLRDAFDSGHIGKVIAAYRPHPWHGRPVSQAVVARWLGVGQSRLSRIENGAPIRDLDRLIELAELLEIPAGYLWFSRAGQRKPPQDGRSASTVDDVDRNHFLKATLGSAPVWWRPTHSPNC